MNNETSEPDDMPSLDASVALHLKALSDNENTNGSEQVVDDSLNEGIASDDILDERSKVSPEKKLTRQQLFAFVIAGIVVLLFILSSCSHTASKQAATPLKSQGSEAELNANEAALNNESQNRSSLQEAIVPITGDKPNPNSGETQGSEQQLSQADILAAQQKQEEMIAEQRALQARLSAPSSFMAGGGESKGASENSSADAGTGSASTSTTGTVLAGKGSNSDFANQQTGVDTASANEIAHPDYTVAQGELIQATLETPIDSDLPGMVRAVTTEPVYAYTGNSPLIPAGSRLIGQYSSGVIQGQSRIMVIWNRVVLPGGISAQLNSPGTDDQGVSGEGADSINRHFWGQFGEATLLSIIGAGSANAGVSGSDQYNSASAYRSALSGSFSDTAGSVLDQSMDVKPTLRIFQGAQINVFVARDVDFTSVLNQG